MNYFKTLIAIIAPFLIILLFGIMFSLMTGQPLVEGFTKPVMESPELWAIIAAYEGLFCPFIIRAIWEG